MWWQRNLPLTTTVSIPARFDLTMPSTKTIMHFGSGDQKYAVSRLSHVADFVVRVLRNTEKYRYGPAYFTSHTVTTN